MKLSFEFFPPRTNAQQRRMWRTLGALETLSPEFVSMTWGALGSDQSASMSILSELLQTGTPIAAHLTCCGETQSTMRKTLADLRTIGIDHIVALRGDMPEGKAIPHNTMMHAIDLVKLIQDESKNLPSPTQISVAAYPETHPDSANADEDLKHLREKLDAGASRALTQFFFDADSFLSWRDNAVASGIKQAIVPGILPIHDIEKVLNFSKRCGANVPDDLVKSFRRYSDKESLKKVAIEQAYELCQTLQREGTEEFHFYTLNQTDLSWHVSCLLKGKEKLVDLVLDSAA